ncbi:aldehyde dehydrogenase family protein [Nocardioides terrisoli]|uniref:aldehyde dehydrogenase family protein n=1 Tax=Nocardioides terrisoli TaxID=3388267 RepID=UPI00287BB0D8|nr:aldehyde dehydrogenase family protein [Nocardioides marmorisolisilvae]
MTSLPSSAGVDERAPAWNLDLLVGDKSVAGNGPELTIPDPTTTKTLTTFATADLSQVDAAIDAARRAFDEGPWPRMSPRERSLALHRVADKLETLQATLSAGVILEVGTPVALADTLQTDLAVQTLREYADRAAEDGTVHLGPHFVPTTSVSLVARRPVGVAAVITAYNFPILLAMRGMGAALAAGCTGVLLPSPRAPLTTLLLAEVFSELPPGVVNIVVGGPDVGQRLTTHPGVDKVAFTGSMAVGAHIMRQAAETAKSISLELGDKSPAVVLPDADLESQVPSILMGYLANSGQSCGATTRILVPRSRWDEFAERARRFIEALPAGDPWAPSTAIGPLIRPEHRDHVQARVDAALESGATVIGKGSVPDLDGWFMPAYLLGGVDNQAPVSRQELFGPVGVLLPYDDIADAVTTANDTPYGLHAKVFTTDLEAGLKVAAQLRVGSVQVNGGGFRPDAPFGGMKQSGVGREYGVWGIEEFSEAQHVQWAMA